MTKQGLEAEKRNYIERRIFLKEQLIELTKKEIEVLKGELSQRAKTLSQFNLNEGRYAR